MALTKSSDQSHQDSWSEARAAQLASTYRREVCPARVDTGGVRGIRCALAAATNTATRIEPRPASEHLDPSEGI
jgi:hypothetical protein